MIEFSNIFDFVVQQESSFKQPIPIHDDWEWSWVEHIKTSVFYKFGRLLTGNDDDKPVKNIVRPILNLAYRSEDIDVKDIHIYVNDPEKFHLSFLIKKYHDDVFVKESKLDEFFDEVKEEKIDFGGSLIQKMEGARPMKVSLQSISFCDQSNLMGAPFGIKISMNPSELLGMKENGWGDKKNKATMTIEELIALMDYQKEKNKQTERPVKTPGKYCDVYQVWGVMPRKFLGEDSDEFCLQLHYITFLQGQKEGTKNGVTLFAMEDKDKDRFKFVNRDKVYGRALGFGGVEELFEAQVWTNYSMIRKKEMLDAASKTILQTDDATLAARHPSGLKDMDNLEVLELEEGKRIGQIDTFPRNYQLFTNSVQEWENYAQRTGSATDPLLGEASPSGTPFRSQERQVIEGKGIHEYRKEKYSTFIEEVYQDWIIPYISKELINGKTFLSELSRDEMEYVSDCVVRNKANDFIKEKILNGELITPEEVETEKQRVRDEFTRDNKKFIKILKNEMRGVKLKVKVSVSGNKDLVGMTDKLTNVFRQIFANPAILDDPRMAKIFNKILEYSGLNVIDFTSNYQKPQQLAQPQMQQMPQQQPQPLLTNQNLV